MKRTTKRVAATLIIAAAAAGCSLPATPREQALPQAAEGVTAIEVHTQMAQRQVQEAIPHADATGQVHLDEAQIQHQAALSSASEVKQSLACARNEIAQVHTDLQQQQLNLQKLQGQWYVVWGLRLEKFFWTLATVYLLGSAASLLMGIGSPISWIGKLRNAVVAWRVAMPANMPATVQA